MIHEYSCIFYDGNPLCFITFSGKDQHKVVSWNEIPDGNKVYELDGSGRAFHCKGNFNAVAS